MTGLETALNESSVLGLRVDPADSACELRLHVLAQPAAPATADPDPRRVLRLLRPSRIRVVLRADGLDGYGPPIPLAGEADVETFFASLEHWESQCFCQAAGVSAGRGGSWYVVRSRSMAQSVVIRRRARAMSACLWFLPSVRLRS